LIYFLRNTTSEDDPLGYIPLETGQTGPKRSSPKQTVDDELKVSFLKRNVRENYLHSSYFYDDPVDESLGLPNPYSVDDWVDLHYEKNFGDSNRVMQIHSPWVGGVNEAMLPYMKATFQTYLGPLFPNSTEVLLEGVPEQPTTPEYATLMVNGLLGGKWYFEYEVIGDLDLWIGFDGSLSIFIPPPAGCFACMFNPHRAIVFLRFQDVHGKLQTSFKKYGSPAQSGDTLSCKIQFSDAIAFNAPLFQEYFLNGESLGRIQFNIPEYKGSFNCTFYGYNKVPSEKNFKFDHRNCSFIPPSGFSCFKSSIVPSTSRLANVNKNYAIILDELEGKPQISPSHYADQVLTRSRNQSRWIEETFGNHEKAMNIDVLCSLLKAITKSAPSFKTVSLAAFISKCWEFVTGHSSLPLNTSICESYSVDDLNTLAEQLGTIIPSLEIPKELNSSFISAVADLFVFSKYSLTECYVTALRLPKSFLKIKLEEMNDVLKTFHEICVGIAPDIVQEKSLDIDQKRHKPVGLGGVAGGEKFIVKYVRFLPVVN
jgi:hypothetical protein